MALGDILRGFLGLAPREAERGEEVWSDYVQLMYTPEPPKHPKHPKHPKPPKPIPKGVPPTIKEGVEPEGVVTISPISAKHESGAILQEDVSQFVNKWISEKGGVNAPWATDEEIIAKVKEFFKDDEPDFFLIGNQDNGYSQLSEYIRGFQWDAEHHGGPHVGYGLVCLGSREGAVDGQAVNDGRHFVCVSMYYDEHNPENIKVEYKDPYGVEPNDRLFAGLSSDLLDSDFEESERRHYYPPLNVEVEYATDRLQFDSCNCGRYSAGLLVESVIRDREAAVAKNPAAIPGGLPSDSSSLSRSASSSSVGDECSSGGRKRGERTDSDAAIAELLQEQEAVAKQIEDDANFAAALVAFEQDFPNCDLSGEPDTNMSVSEFVQLQWAIESSLALANGRSG